MKRSRDDAFSSSQLKGAATPSPTESSRKVKMSTAKSAEKLQTTDALLYLKVVKERFRDKGDMYNEFLEIMKKFKAQRVDTTGVIGKVKELFRGDRDLILGFNAFLPEGYEITLPPEYEPPLKKKGVDYEEVIGLLNKVKNIFQGDHEVYKAFLDILYNYRKNDMSATEVYQEVSVLFQDHADLLLEFTHYFPDTPVTNHILQQNSGGSPVTTAWPIEQKSAKGDKYVNCPDSEQLRVSKKKQDRGESRDKTMRGYNDNLHGVRKSAAGDDSAYYKFHKGKQRLRSLKVYDRVAEEHNKEDTNKNKDDANIERDRHDKGVKRPKVSTMKEKHMAKSIHELDISNCKLANLSYRYLPSNYPIPSVRWRTKIGNEVLNDHWVSVPSRSEDYSFKHLPNNPYEDCFNECEDDRFELDMLLETVSATAKHVEELQDSMNSHTFETESSFRIDDYLTAVHLRCIERLYGDYGLEILDMLRKDPSTALPVILPRLKQKQEEWARCQTDLNKIWAETYAKNFHKSLDHRSFSIKQQDTKNLSAASNNCRSSDMSKSGNYGIENGGSPCVNNAAASEVDISCNATVNGVLETESEREEGEISPIKNQDGDAENDIQDVSEGEVEGDADIQENERRVAFSGHVIFTGKPLNINYTIITRS